MPDKRRWSAVLAQGLVNLAGRIEERQGAGAARDTAPDGLSGPVRSPAPGRPAPAGTPGSRTRGSRASAAGTGTGAGTPGAPGTGTAAAGARAGGAVPAQRATERAHAAPPDPAAVVPWSMRVAAEVGWRLLILAGTVWVLMRVIGAVRLVVLAFVAGLLVTALLQPFVARLKRLGVPRGLATALVCAGGFVVMGLVGWFVVWQVMDNADNLSSSLQDGIAQGKKWLLDSPFHVTEDQINQVANNLSNALSHNTEQLTDAGLQGVTVIVELLTGLLLAMFSTIFLLYDGPNIWNWVLRLFPAAAREGLAGAGPRAWRTLTLYVRGTVIVAMIDAIFIGVGIFFLGVPMAVPLAVVIFLSSFVPLVGAVASGAIAVVVALVTQGPFTALMVLVVVLAVQQIEGHVLQPFILGRAVRVHPLAVVLSVAAGSMVAGIGGAVVAVPLVAVGNTVVGYLRAHARGVAAPDEPGPHGATRHDLVVAASAPGAEAADAAGEFAGDLAAGATGEFTGEPEWEPEPGAVRAAEDPGGADGDGADEDARDAAGPDDPDDPAAAPAARKGGTATAPGSAADGDDPTPAA